MKKLTYPDGEVMEPYCEFEINGTHYKEPDHEVMASMLMAEGIVFIGDMLVNNKTPCVLQAMCSDTFYYSCADCEPLNLKSLVELFELHEKDPMWGATRWACIARQWRPMEVVVERMKAAGAWDEVLEALPRPS